jgi:hypothetical protein
VEVDITTGKIVWEYEAHHSNSFFTYRQGAAQRLPNGNVHVTSTHGGHLFEVTPNKKIVWDYVSPVDRDKLRCFHEDGFGHNNMWTMIHRSYRYNEDHPGLKGKDLSQRKPLANCPEFFKIYNTIE